MHLANMLIDWNCFSGEQCGPWASCLLDGTYADCTFLSVKIKLVTHIHA